MRRLIRDVQPDVLHTQLFGADMYGRLVGAWMRIPVVSTVQSSVYENPEPFHHSLKRKWLDRAMATRCVTRMIAVSEFVKRSIVSDLGVPEERVQVIPNSVEPDPFEQVDADRVRGLRGQLGCSPATSVVVSVGKLIPPKGHRLGLEAIHILSGSVPELCWLMVGDGPCRADLEHLVQQWGLSSRVRFLGVRRDIPELLAASDLFLFPSTSAEGLPVALLEAMAAGKACVGFRIGPVPEVIEHGRTGLVVEPRSPEALAEAMRAVLEDPVRCQAMGEAGRRRVYERFHADQSAQCLGALYHSILRRS